jgi:hypothetical protein
MAGTAGRPHSEQLKVEETFHRVSADAIDVFDEVHRPGDVLRIPVQATNKLILHKLPDDFDIPELLCSPSEFASTTTRWRVRCCATSQEIGRHV